MKRQNLFPATMLLLFAAMLFNACKKDSTVPDTDSAPEKGYLTGLVTNYANAPLNEVKIVMDNAILSSDVVTGKTDDQGKYKIKVPYGTWTASAFVTRKYHQKEYFLACDPDEISSFTDDGAVRNFKWKISGQIPNVVPSQYYGGSIGIYPADNSIIPDNTYIQLTLTPVGPLIDGSAGTPIVLGLGQEKWMEPYEIKDIPIGRYKATIIFKADEDLPLKVRNCFNDGSFQYETTFDFEPEKSYRSRTWYKAVVLEYHE